MCQNKQFAIAIATHGASVFTQVQNVCSAWDQNCSQPSTCKDSKRCQAIKALNLANMDPALETNCSNESDFVQHDPHVPKGTMVATILGTLKAAKKINTSSKSFKIWFFDDEGRNRNSVADQQANFSAVFTPLGVQVQTCAFSPDEWTTYQSDHEGFRGNNLGMGLDMGHVEKQTSGSTPWLETTSTGCKMSA